MKYLIECRNVFNKDDLTITNTDGDIIANITFTPKESEYQFEILELETNTKLYVESNPLKPKNRFRIFNDVKKPIGKVGMGVKIIHSIIELDKYYFVKSAFWKIRYTVYDNRVVFASLDLVRKDKNRFYEIETKEKDIVMVSAMFLLAHAVRLKSIIN